MVEGRLRVASVQQKSLSVDSIITRLWSLYSLIEKTSTDNALRELYGIMNDVNHFIVHLIEVKPAEAFLRDRLVAYENAIGEVKKNLVTLIRLKHYHRARAEILRLIDVLQALAKEEEIYNIVLKASPSTGHSGGVTS